MRIPSLWGQHALDVTTIVKARMNNAGKASALIQQEWHRRSVFTISGEVDSNLLTRAP
ncbi:hypothetical protein CCACVL1_04922, partial [Corchorus capsularis]